MANTADSDSNSGKHDASRGIERSKPWDSADDVPWTLLTEPQLAEAYRAVVEPALRAADRDPATDRPSYEWLSNNGFRGLIYALSEYHDTTFATFWADTLGYSEAETDDNWGIEHDPTRESMQRWLRTTQEDRGADGWSEATHETLRYRLSRYAQSYREKHGDDDLLTPVDPDSGVSKTAAIDRCRDAFRHMRNQGYADATIARVHDVVRRWYRSLETRALATVNPTNGADDHFQWSRSNDKDPVALSAAQVGALSDAAVSGRDRMLVIALCAWGLRAGEVAALHEDQLALDGDEPHITFDERKNGPGTVAVVYGVAEAQRYAARRDGYLFPSERSQTGHVYPSTVADWFHDLADRVGIPEEIDGQRRKPHMGRRFWYEAYSETMGNVLAFIDEIAADQGSTSAEVVRDDYMSDERVREQRREYMRERLADAFGINE